MFRPVGYGSDQRGRANDLSVDEKTGHPSSVAFVADDAEYRVHGLLLFVGRCALASARFALSIDAWDIKFSADNQSIHASHESNNAPHNHFVTPRNQFGAALAAFGSSLGAAYGFIVLMQLEASLAWGWSNPHCEA